MEMLVGGGCIWGDDPYPEVGGGGGPWPETGAYVPGGGGAYRSGPACLWKFCAGPAKTENTHHKL